MKVERTHRWVARLVMWLWYVRDLDLTVSRVERANALVIGRVEILDLDLLHRLVILMKLRLMML